MLFKDGVHPKVVSEMLGHASTAITMDLYSHVMPGMQQAAANKLDDLIFGSPKDSVDFGVKGSRIIDKGVMI